jgi:hypothetical protein
MSERKHNIFSLAWRHAVCPLAKAADPTSWVLFACFLLMIVACGLISVFGDGAMKELYNQYFAVFWYGSWVLMVLSTVGPMFNLYVERRDVPLEVLVATGIAHVVVFITLGIVTLWEDKNIGAITALFAATATAITVGIGWGVQHQSSAKASRRTHTFNILMQSRLSSEFQGQVKKRVERYPAGVPVTAADAPLITKKGLDERLKQLEDRKTRELSRSKPEKVDEIEAQYAAEKAESEAKYEALQGMRYLLNFYEFMSAGIILRELDETMLAETLKDIAVGLYKDSLHVRMHQRESQPKVFENLDKIVGVRWGGL